MNSETLHQFLKTRYQEKGANFTFTARTFRGALKVSARQISSTIRKCGDFVIVSDSSGNRNRYRTNFED